MTEQLALHTAARHYCEERAAYWHIRYAELGSHINHGGYTKEEKDIFPRYNVLEAILVEVERLRPELLASEQQARELLSLAGQVAESMFTTPPNAGIQKRVMQQERDLFSVYIHSLDSKALAQIAPMPSRRVLLQEESRAVWEQLNRRWVAAGGYWYPLSGEIPPNTVAFNADAFEEYIPSLVLQNILGSHSIQSVFELREYGPEYELDLALLVPSYNGAEGYWTAGGCDWLVYASHECTITVAGQWLVDAVQQRWTQWSEHQIRW